MGTSPLRKQISNRGVIFCYTMVEPAMPLKRLNDGPAIKQLKTTLNDLTPDELKQLRAFLYSL